MRFDWRQAEDEEAPLARRFPDSAIGFGAWAELASMVEEPASADPGAMLDAFLRMVDAAGQGGPPSPGRASTLFISHQRRDVGFAERVAYLGCQAGLDYWLDIHDPVLRVATGTISPTDPRYPVIIAAIIEMALLNCSHIVAVHSDHSLKSRWVPYEFGRARDRRIRSFNSGSWFHPRTRAAAHGDYLSLSRTSSGGETDVKRWLSRWSPGGSSVPWPAGYTPSPLP